MRYRSSDGCDLSTRLIYIHVTVGKCYLERNDFQLHGFRIGVIAFALSTICVDEGGPNLEAKQRDE